MECLLQDTGRSLPEKNKKGRIHRTFRKESNLSLVSAGIVATLSLCGFPIPNTFDPQKQILLNHEKSKLAVLPL